MPTPGPLELVIILVIALLILGPGKLPDVGAALGKSIREFRKASTDVQDAVKVDTSPLPADADRRWRGSGRRRVPAAAADAAADARRPPPPRLRPAACRPGRERVVASTPASEPTAGSN